MLVIKRVTQAGGVDKEAEGTGGEIPESAGATGVEAKCFPLQVSFITPLGLQRAALCLKLPLGPGGN